MRFFLRRVIVTLTQLFESEKEGFNLTPTATISLFMSVADQEIEGTKTTVLCLPRHGKSFSPTEHFHSE